jgi:hypothetical protein
MVLASAANRGAAADGFRPAYGGEGRGEIGGGTGVYRNPYRPYYSNPYQGYSRNPYSPYYSSPYGARTRIGRALDDEEDVEGYFYRQLRTRPAAPPTFNPVTPLAPPPAATP